MPRVKVELPRNFPFVTTIPIRITDLNYGKHVGNDSFLALIHEARVRFLANYGMGEFSFEGAGLIMNDVAIEFKAEVFYGDTLKIYVAAGDFTSIGFDLYYKLVKEEGEKIVALAKTGMVCYNYDAKKPVRIPEAAKNKLIQS